MKKKDPKLTASPYELGISRADLWAFSGLIALDYIQAETKEFCNDFSNKAMCGDNSTSCFAPFPEEDKKMLFKTGKLYLTIAIQLNTYYICKIV